ncbi:VOC family protein [Candidatus Binatus sp.]|uniref:VOC family protein n=1 Tax=Candidatus Binatus sp. TaxID=2811406 RepID=UPI003CC56384
MFQVRELGYMGIGVKDLDAWKHFATSIVGFELADEGESDRCYLRMDYMHHRIVMHADGSDDLSYLGFRVAGADEFAQMQRQLAEAGIKFRVGSAEEAEERRVLEVIKLDDPDGNPVEIFHGPFTQFSKPFHPGRAMHGRFKTGSGGLGHCIIRERDVNAAQRFYAQLGMRGGVEYKFGAGKHSVGLVFMHCNDRDHTVAFGIPGDRRLNHVMLEVDNLDDVGMTYDLVRTNKIPVTITPGKHSNDHMYSFYFRTPSGWMFEYGWGARPATYQSEYFTGDVYGHQPEAGGFEIPREKK